MSLTIASAQGNGTSTPVRMSGKSFRDSKPALIYTCYIYGTFNGASVTLEVSPDGVEWFDVPGAEAITSKLAINLEFNAAFIRCTVAGGTSPSINIDLF